MSAIRLATSAVRTRTRFNDKFPWMTSPYIVAAPMRVFSGPHLAITVSSAGGLGFIGPGEKPESTAIDLATAKKMLRSSASVPTSLLLSEKLPVGVGFQLWNGDLKLATQAVKQHRPCAAWLFAPRGGQEEVDEWTVSLRKASPGIHIWYQIGTLDESIKAMKSDHRPDVLVVQGAEAGGHGRAKDGLGLMALFPEITDQVRGSGIALVAAGGVADGRGIAAALALGADGVAVGTRFLASTEARIKKGYQNEIVRANDAAKNTTRTQLYNHLRGTMGWPEHWSPRGIVNKTWHDHQAGVPFEELKQRHDEAVKAGDGAWGPEGRTATYAGAAIGLVHDVEDAGVLVERMRKEAQQIIKALYES